MLNVNVFKTVKQIQGQVFLATNAHGLKIVLKIAAVSVHNGVEELNNQLDQSIRNEDGPQIPGVVRTFVKFKAPQFHDGKFCTNLRMKDYIAMEYIPGRIINWQESDLILALQLAYTVVLLSKHLKLYHPDLHAKNIIVRDLGHNGYHRYGLTIISNRYLPTLVDASLKAIEEMERYTIGTSIGELLTDGDTRIFDRYTDDKIIDAIDRYYIGKESVSPNVVITRKSSKLTGNQVDCPSNIVELYEFHDAIYGRLDEVLGTKNIRDVHAFIDELLSFVKKGLKAIDHEFALRSTADELLAVFPDYRSDELKELLE